MGLTVSHYGHHQFFTVCEYGRNFEVPNFGSYPIWILQLEINITNISANSAKFLTFAWWSLFTFSRFPPIFWVYFWVRSFQSRIFFCVKSQNWLVVFFPLIWVWVNTYRYIFSGMNIHKSQLWLGVHQGYQGFDPSPDFKDQHDFFVNEKKHLLLDFSKQLCYIYDVIPIIFPPFFFFFPSHVSLVSPPCFVQGGAWSTWFHHPSGIQLLETVCFCRVYHLVMSK